MPVIPMFPLERPVVPSTAIPLHVFEDRYRRMISEVWGGERRLGIVMIERGSEVGGGDLRKSVGTLARIAEAEELEDGRWLAIAVGLERIKVRHWLGDEPYPRAEIEPFPPHPPSEGQNRRRAIEVGVRRIAALLTELDEPGPPVTIDLADDPVAAAYQALVASPIGAHDAQRILEIADGDALLDAVLEALSDTEELARLRLSAG